MKYTIKPYDVHDPTNLPWDIVVADTVHPGVLTVQEPHPEAGCNLVGFDIDPEDYTRAGFVSAHGKDWTTRAVDRHPVLVKKGGRMFALMGYGVDKVIVDDPLRRVEGPVNATYHFDTMTTRHTFDTFREAVADVEELAKQNGALMRAEITQGVQKLWSWEEQ